MKYKFAVLLALAIAAAQPAMAQVFDISFDGTCAGLRLEVSPDLMVGGVHTGCVSGVVVGNVAGDFTAFPFHQASGICINIRPRRKPGEMSVGHTLLNLRTLQFGVYVTLAGEPPFLVQLGTFSFGPPPAESASLPAALPRRDPVAAPLAVGPEDIAFDGFCDGLRLEVDDDDMVGGSHTGCESGLFAGNVTFNFSYFPFDQQSGFGLTLGTFPNHPGGHLTLLNFATNEFAHYQTILGEVPTLVSSGTFSFGVPSSLVSAASSLRNPR